MIHLITNSDDELAECGIPIKPDCNSNRLKIKPIGNQYFSQNKDKVTCNKCLRKPLFIKTIKTQAQIEQEIIEILVAMEIIVINHVKEKLSGRKEHITRKYLQDLIDKYHLENIKFKVCPRNPKKPTV